MFTKKILILFLALSFNTLAAFSREGGSTVGNGGGVSENNLIEAWNRLPYYIEQISNAKGLNLSTLEISQFKSISLRWKSEQMTEVKFYTEAQFKFNNQAYVFGKLVGAGINFNLDKIYNLSSNSDKMPYGIGDSVGIFTKILSRNDKILNLSQMTALLVSRI